MGKTFLTIEGSKFKMNGKLVYEELEGAKKEMHGMLMNQRFIQGIFDSKDRIQFERYGKSFNPDQNVKELIEALPEWYDKGLRAITVGMQGGGSCFTIPSKLLQNNPYSADGKYIDEAYLARLGRVIRACDEIGMVVIVSYFYCANLDELNGANAVIEIVKGMSTYLKEQGYTNVMIEIANEYSIKPFEQMPIIHEPQGMVALIRIAQECAGTIPVGSSGGGGQVNKEVCEASDVVIIHGNGESRTRLYNHIRETRSYSLDKPIIINEDSQAIGQLKVCEELQTSWGYYNNMTKQEPPTYWGITKGEDAFFAWRMADMIGITQDDIPLSDQYYFQGFEPHMHHKGMRYPRLAALYPESIDFVRFYQNGTLYYVCYDESFTVHFKSNWEQGGVMTQDGDVWKAEVVLRDGEVLVLEEIVKNE
ncbi:MAG: hypothetical protein R3Y47_09825 [Lachnospiraceae bacterium]